MTSQLYLARGIAAGMIRAGSGDQDPALQRSAQIALAIARAEEREGRRARRGRLAR